MVSSEDATRIDMDTDDAGRFVDLGPIMGRLPLGENAALPAGTAVLGDWARAKPVTDSQMRITAMDGTPHRTADGIIDGSLWEHNELLLRCVMRMGGLAITLPTAFTVVALTAPTTT